MLIKDNDMKPACGLYAYCLTNRLNKTKQSSIQTGSKRRSSSTILLFSSFLYIFIYKVILFQVPVGFHGVNCVFVSWIFGVFVQNRAKGVYGRRGTRDLGDFIPSFYVNCMVLEHRL